MNRPQVLLADPPWRYNSRAHHKTRFRGGACGHYPLMKTDDLCALPVKDVVAESAVLFLWACFPMLTDALRVVESWGFTYKTTGFVWMKTNPRNGKPFFGVGYYTKSCCELCLLATRGAAMKPATNTVSQVIISPRQEHSRKPAETHERIERLYPDVPKLELFARAARPGWISLGNDLTGNDIAEDLRRVLAGENPAPAPPKRIARPTSNVVLDL